MLTRFHAYAIVLLFAVTSARAVVWIGNIPVFSTEVGCPELSNILARAEELRRQGQFMPAADTLQLALQLDDPAARTELARGHASLGPLALQILYIRALYLNIAEHSRSATALHECQTALVQYADAAKGKAWRYYTEIHEQLIVYYKAMADTNSVHALYRAQIAYDPKNERSVRNYVAFLMDQHAPAATIQKTITELGGGAPVATRALLGCQVRARNGEAVLPDLIAWLDANPQAPLADIRDALGLAATQLDPAQPELLKQYHKTLTKLALRQPGDQAHMEIIAYVLNEKKKLETIMPELEPQQQP